MLKLIQEAPVEVDSDTQVDCVLGIFNASQQIGEVKALVSDLGVQSQNGIFFVYDSFASFSSVRNSKTLSE
jgi:hypothetical protein